jgi:hypothetical protein
MTKNNYDELMLHIIILVYYFCILTVKTLAMWMNKFYIENFGWIDTISPIEFCYVIFLLIFPFVFYLTTYFFKRDVNRIQKTLINLGPLVLVIYLFLL